MLPVFKFYLLLEITLDSPNLSSFMFLMLHFTPQMNYRTTLPIIFFISSTVPRSAKGCNRSSVELLNAPCESKYIEVAHQSQCGCRESRPHMRLHIKDTLCMNISFFEFISILAFSTSYSSCFSFFKEATWDNEMSIDFSI